MIFTTEGHPLFISATSQNRTQMMSPAPVQFQPVKPKVFPVEDQLRTAIEKMMSKVIGDKTKLQNQPLQCTAGPNGNIVCNPGKNLITEKTTKGLGYSHASLSLD